uniref:Uncharacterized protein n=1 Tax=Gorilla gorilla gorilla TaxID=9595 RepID=A0A2I2ZCC8_GORGO
MASYFLAPLSGRQTPTQSRDTPYMVHHPLHTTLSERAGSATYKFEHVPVEHVVIGEALAMEQIPEKLPLVVKTQGTAEIQVCGKFGYKTRNSKLTHETQLRLKVSLPTSLSTSCCCTLKGRRTDAKHLSDF